MFAGADEHPASHTHEFVDAAHKRVIEKDSSPLGSDAQLDLCCDLWKLRSRILQHDQFQYGFPAGFDKHLLREIRISRLTHDDFMFARQKEDFHIVLELIDVANVLPVDPNAGRLSALVFPTSCTSPRTWFWAMEAIQNNRLKKTTQKKDLWNALYVLMTTPQSGDVQSPRSPRNHRLSAGARTGSFYAQWATSGVKITGHVLVSCVAVNLGTGTGEKKGQSLWKVRASLQSTPA